MLAESTTSSNSDSDATCLHTGICLSHTSVDSIDVSIAVKALEIFVFCFESRPDLIGTRCPATTVNNALNCLLIPLAYGYDNLSSSDSIIDDFVAVVI